jgi:predicted helicase
LEAFLAQTPESINSGLRLAQIMGGRARRLRDNIIEYLKNDSDKNRELLRIYEMMKELLVHDLELEKFADMYAQTLVYGLFVARYNDSTAENFTRNEARDLVPKSNPFLLQFFDHIVGPNFDTRLAYIVDELCEIFSVSNVQEIVHKHLRIQDESIDEKAPIIHFYEDFLQAYDPQERKRMGAYYTPVPVVRYIIRQVDRILKEDFGIANGIASDEMTTQTITVQPYRRPGERKDRTTDEISVPRVQILDPAVGTATFLNETIKFIYQGFKGQEGRWSSYVNQNLLKRLYGFELMMAPYTIAHMKLGMTLNETGVEELQERLGVYLTNTLENIVPVQMGLFNIGLSYAISEESRLAAQVKREHPVMVVMGNPPYSISSTNKSQWILDLIGDYKVGLNERKINLDDDYIKFIRFAEHMIEKNGSGIVAMITNSSYLDGITHRQMRKHLLKTFDKIYILDLHGSAIKQEISPDGSKDENVFDIMQGVSIVLMVKKASGKSDIGSLFHAEIFGTRILKFSILNDANTTFTCTPCADPNYFFSPRDFSEKASYEQFVSLEKLFVVKNSGVKTDRDALFIADDPTDLKERIQRALTGNYDDIFLEKYRIVDSGSYKLTEELLKAKFDVSYITKILYRPFDKKYIYYDPSLVSRPGYHAAKHMLNHDNISLIISRQFGSRKHFIVFCSDIINEISSQPFAPYYCHPLYAYYSDQEKGSNFDVSELNRLTKNLEFEPSPEQVFDYIYANLYSPSYREKYEEFLKIGFPRVPIPIQSEFDRLVPLGTQLRELHLMKSPIIDEYETTFPVAGHCMVEKIKYDASKVWINKTQYFGNVPELAWNFYIGGYQPAQQWLKHRKGRQLSDHDLVHYQRIIKILLETDLLMKEIG